MYKELEVMSFAYYKALNNLGKVKNKLEDYQNAHESYIKSVEGYLSIKKIN